MYGVIILSVHLVWAYSRTNKACRQESSSMTVVHNSPLMYNINLTFICQVFFLITFSI